MHLTLHLTTECNMRCSYCYAPPHPGPVMTFEIARQALDMGARMTGGSCGIVFFGGEPLLHKDLIGEIVQYAASLEKEKTARFHFKMTTNGLLLDQAFIKFSLEHNILIAMSLDGVREAHDRHRRLPNGVPSFDLLLPRMDMLLAARPYSSVLLVVNPDTARNLCDSVSLLLDHQCRYIIVSLNYAADWHDTDFAILKKQMEKLGRLYVSWMEAGRKFYLSPFEVKISSHINRHNYQKERCELAARQISIDPQGFLYPCVQFTRAGPGSSWCIGSVEAGVDEERRAALRAQSEAEKQSCLSCAVSARCNNTCGCLNWQTTGGINLVSPVLCRYEQMVMPIADRIAARLYSRRDPLFLHKHYNSAYPVISLLEDTLPGRKK